MIRVLYRSRQEYRRIPYTDVEPHAILTCEQCRQEGYPFPEYDEAFFQTRMLVVLSLVLTGIPLSLVLEHSIVRNGRMTVIFRETSGRTQPAALDFYTFLYETGKNEEVTEFGTLILREVI